MTVMLYLEIVKPDVGISVILFHRPPLSYRYSIHYTHLLQKVLGENSGVVLMDVLLVPVLQKEFQISGYVFGLCADLHTSLS